MCYEDDEIELSKVEERMSEELNNAAIIDCDIDNMPEKWEVGEALLDNLKDYSDEELEEAVEVSMKYSVYRDNVASGKVDKDGWTNKDEE